MVEGFHRDVTKVNSVGGASCLQRAPETVSRLRVLRYEDVETKNDFA